MEDKASSTYPITPIAYYKRYIGNIESHNSTQDKSFLLYAALELRFTIESLLFYYLHATNGGNLSKAQKKLYRPADLKNAILQVDPLFLVKFEFADMCNFFNGSISSELKPDIVLLCRTHGRLGAWLHAEYSPLKNKVPEEEWAQLGELFDTVSDHMSLLLSHPLLQVNYTPLGEDLLKKYVARDIQRDELIQRMNEEWNRIFQGVTQHIVLDE
jgi:hypothetical protein